MKKNVAICLVLCMILSSFVFALPASANSDIVVETDYSSYLDADDSYIINPEWVDEITDSTAEGTELSSFFFNGKMRTVKYQKGKHFSDYDDAFALVFDSGKIDETNYFDVNPTFIFAPGTYTKHVNIPTGGKILGPQAGISPNAALTDADRTAEAVGNNGGWDKNPQRLAKNEATFTMGVYFSTRYIYSDGIYWAEYNEVNDTVRNSWSYPWYKERATLDNPGEATECLIDGITVAMTYSAYNIAFYGVGKGHTVKNAGDEDTALNIQGYSNVNAVIRNVINDSSKIFINCQTTTYDRYDIEVYNMRSEVNNNTLFNQYMRRLKLENSYISNYSRSITAAWNITSQRNENPRVELYDNIFYNNTPSSFIQLQPGYVHMEFTAEGNTFYNSYNSANGLVSLKNAGNRNLIVNMTDNEIYYDRDNGGTLFYAPAADVVSGKTIINFNKNRVIGTVKSILPSSGHDATTALNCLYYNFNYNFFGESADSVGKAPAFIEGTEPAGPTGVSAYDWENPIYYLEYEMTELSDTPDGIGFEEEYNYFSEKRLASVPYTYEAWINIPDTTPDGVNLGVIVGNKIDGVRNSHVSLLATEGGVPELFWRDEEQCEYHAVFDTVDLRTGKWTHIAVVFDSEASAVHCYIDGELKQTVRNLPKMSYAVTQYPMVVGGDNGVFNPNFFRGRIKGVTLWADSRTADEVKADMTAVDINGKDILADYTLDVNCERMSIKDNSANGYDLTCSELWLTEEQMEDLRDDSFETAYSLAVVGDTQCITDYNPHKLPTLYQWIVDNKDSKKIQYVVGVGDITNNDTEEEWEVAKKSISIMDGKIDYSLVRGDHDVLTGDAFFDQYFADDTDYTDQFTQNGGFYEEGSVKNTWRTITLGGQDYLFINFDWGASYDLLDWASNIINSHPDHKVIITTHTYVFLNALHYNADMQSAANLNYSSDVRLNGDVIWREFISKHENIEMVICGHTDDEEILISQPKGDNGNLVTEICIDAQAGDGSGDGLGMVALLNFNADGTKMNIEFYSTILGKYYKTTNQRSVDLTVEGTEVNDVGTDIKPDGEGTKESPYLVSSRENLLWMSRNIKYTSAPTFDGVYFKQTNDIDLEGETIRPIGYYFNDLTAMAAFGGTYDGGGYKIKNGLISSFKDTNNFRLRYGDGLFGVIYGAEIKNVTLENITVVGRIISGPVVGWAASNYDGTATSDFNKITNCHVTEDCKLVTMLSVGRSVNSSMDFDNHWRAGLTGGLAGKLHATTVSYCTSAVRFAVEAKFTHSGGIAGAAGLNTEIDHCKFTGGIELMDYNIPTARMAVGGIVGLISPFSQTLLQNDSDNDLESLYGATNIGGLKITNCVNSGSFVYTGDAIPNSKNLVWGGIIGYAGWLDGIEYEGTNYPYYVENCYNLYSRQTEAVLADHTNSWIGGIIGKAHLTAGSTQGNLFLKDCYSVEVDIDDTSDEGADVVGTNEYRVENKRNADGYLGVEVIGDSVSTMTAEQMAPAVAAIDDDIELYSHGVTHTLKTVSAKAPECEAIGWNEHIACDGCDYTYGYEEIAATGHTLKDVSAKPATCIENGWSAYQACENCDHTEGYNEEKMLGHDLKDVAVVAPTCKETGVSAYKSCSRCDYTEGKTVLETVAHKYQKYTSNNDATCKKDATETAACIYGCGTKDTRTIKDSKADHKLGEYKSDKNATCCKDGTKTAKCIWCDKTDTVTDKGSVLGHKDTTKIFKDLKKDKWYNDAIDYCYTHGFISGMSETEFGVNTPVTRGMFITILARIAGVDLSNNNVKTVFTDVESGKYFTAAIKWGYENKVVSGMSATTFEPNAPIQRQQLAVMIVNFAKFMDIEITSVEKALKFTDEAKIGTYAKDAVKTAQMADIVNGYEVSGKYEFRPINTATRAEAAQILYKFHKEFMNK